MITGKVINREAIVELEVAGPGQVPRQIQTVIDTGYNGHLTLASRLVSALQLPFAGYRRGTLADGSVVVLEVHLAAIVWRGQRNEVMVSKTAGAPLIGMSLLDGSRLTINAIDGGVVTIEDLPRQP